MGMADCTPPMKGSLFRSLSSHSFNFRSGLGHCLLRVACGEHVSWAVAASFLIKLSLLFVSLHFFLFGTSNFFIIIIIIFFFLYYFIDGLINRPVGGGGGGRGVLHVWVCSDPLLEVMTFFLACQPRRSTCAWKWGLSFVWAWLRPMDYNCIQKLSILMRRILVYVARNKWSSK